jgi:death on curing protein
MTVYLNKQDVIYINECLLQQQGMPSPLLSENALESALMRPQTAAYYQNADIVTQGALLIVGITLAHAFLDGNKRAALVAGYDFF